MTKPKKRPKKKAATRSRSAKPAAPSESRVEWLLRVMWPLTEMRLRAAGVPPSPRDYATASICAGFWPPGFDDDACKRGGFTVEDVMLAETSLIERALLQIATMTEGTA